MKLKLKEQIYNYLDPSPDDPVSEKIVNIFIVVLICLNILAVILDTVKNISSQYHHVFIFFEIFSVSIFTIEYLLRVWTCDVNNRFTGTIKGRIKYIFTPMALIDLLAILPFYLPMIIPIDLRFIRIFRLLRMFRALKFGRYSQALSTLGSVFKTKKAELGITVFIVIILLIFTSSLMYLVEYRVQPEIFSSIPNAMWWSVVTLTTVGYGDVYPITPLGKILGSIIAFLGIGLFALPAGIFGSGFVEQFHKKDKAKEVCPHCGKEI
jgi:voltage-gated potassium channel